MDTDPITKVKLRPGYWALLFRVNLFSPMHLPRLGSLIVWLSLLTLIGLTSCDSPETEALPDVPLELTVLRSDSLMREAALMLQGAEPPNYQAAFETHLAKDKLFFAELMGLDQIALQQGLSPQQADSLLIVEFGQVLADSQMLVLLDEIRQAHPYHEDFAARLTPPLKRLLYHFPDLQLPAFRTHVTGYLPAVEMRQVDQILPTPHYFSIGLHYLMGPDYRYYSPTLPAYIKRRFDPRYLEVMAMWEISEGIVAPLPRERESLLVDDIIRIGLKQHLMHQLLPRTPDSLLLRYSSSQMEWATFYEARIYKELMEELFESDFMAKRNYLSDKPYTTTLSAESAPRLGEYLGWRIVEAYAAAHPEVSLAELCETTDYQRLFREAKYRP